MKTLRPCLRCGRDNSAQDETCTACSAPLSAWASEPDRRPVRSARLLSRRFRLLLGVASVVALLALGWLFLRSDDETSGGPGASWRSPSSVAEWASERFAMRGTPADRTLAVVEDRTSRPRRLLLCGFSGELETTAIVRSAAEVLLAAREGGERLLIHAALLEHGPEDQRRRLLVPTSVASRVLTDESALEELLATAQEGTLPALAELAPEPVIEANDPAPAVDGGDTEPETESDDSTPEPVPGARDETDSPAAPQAEPAPEPEPAPESKKPAAQVGRGGGAAPAEPDDADAPPPADPGAQLMPVSVLKGAGQRVARSYEAGEQQIVLLRAWLHPRKKRPLILRSLTVKPYGSLDDVAGIDFVYLVHDRDGNGQRDPRDEQLGDVMAFGDDNAQATWDNLDFAFGADGDLAKLLLVVDFLDRNEGGEVMLTIPGPDGLAIEDVASGLLLRVDGLPFKGTMTTLNGDIEPEPGGDAGE